MNIGEQIRKLRREKNWTQDELGQRVGILGPNITRYESGRTTPRKAMIERFAQAFGLSVEEFESGAVVPKDDLASVDPEMAKLCRELMGLSESERAAVRQVLTLVVKQNKIQQVIAG
jgi:transcriptional regulator with XRE-family HTH domain